MNEQTGTTAGGHDVPVTGPVTAREAVLARIRGALAGDGAAVGDDARGAARTPADIPRDYRHTSELSVEELTDQLIDRLVDYRADVEVIDADDLPGAVARRLTGASSYVVPLALDDPSHSLAELPTDARRLVDSPEAPLDVHTLDQADAVITGSAVSVAQTGTIILDGSPDQGRRAISLVPDHHICVVPVASIVGIVPEAIARLDPARPMTMISGPSATSDIELERVEGVHGPRHLDVLIVR